jgi:hypothetical protein
MPTLPPHEIIPDGVAKRLGSQFGLDRFAATGAIHTPEDRARVIAIVRLASVRDPQGYEADRRALIDYLAAYGPRTAVEGWERLAWNYAVVPWSYGRRP